MKRISPFRWTLPVSAAAAEEASLSWRGHGGRPPWVAAMARGGLFSLLLLAGPLAAAQESSPAAVAADLQAIAAVEAGDQGNASASAAAGRLAELPASRLIEVLEGFRAAPPRAENWLRLIAADVADNGALPREALLTFFNDRDQPEAARYLALQLLVINDGSLQETLLEGAADDPSLPVRFAAIERVLELAAEADEPSQAIDLYRIALANGRNPDQLKTAAKALNERGIEVELAETLGMFRQWWIVGPLDNTDGRGFDTPFAPERAFAAADCPVTAAATVAGKEVGGEPQPVQWQTVTSDDSLGMVDLNKPLDDAKDATAYAWMAFEVSEGGPAQVRLGCINASKVWINGALVDANEVYHSGTRIDQYTAACTLQEGRNTVLLKICQNAQTQSWAQDWQFQFRLTDPQGAALHPTLQPQP